jgi:hypothetical protein
MRRDAIELAVGFERFWLVRETARAPLDAEPVAPWLASRLVQPLLRERDLLDAVAALLLWTFRQPRGSEDSVLTTELVRQLAAAELRLYRAPRRWLPATHPRELPSPPPEIQPPGPETVTEEHWLELSLVDEDGAPVPNVRFEVVLPDGSERRGRLDRDGFARLDGIERAGSCEVRFTNLPDLVQPPPATE